MSDIGTIGLIALFSLLGNIYFILRIVSKETPKVNLVDRMEFLKEILKIREEFTKLHSTNVDQQKSIADIYGYLKKFNSEKADIELFLHDRLSYVPKRIKDPKENEQPKV